MRPKRTSPLDITIGSLTSTEIADLCFGWTPFLPGTEPDIPPPEPRRWSTWAEFIEHWEALREEWAESELMAGTPEPYAAKLARNHPEGPNERICSHCGRSYWLLWFSAADWQHCAHCSLAAEPARS